MSISTFNGLNIASLALAAQQRALDVTSHNIANANTEGYTRQRADLAAAEPLANVGIWGMILPGQLGQGVTVDGYRRIRDVFNDSQLRQEWGRKEAQDVAYRDLSGVQQALPEPGDSGLQSLMTKFWNAWQDVSNNPENVAARQSLVQSAATLTGAMNAAWSQMDALRQNDDSELDSTVTQVNDITAELASLNQKISDLVLAGAQVDPTTLAVIKPGQVPNDLLDRRDVLLDKLSKLGDLTSVTYDDRMRATVTFAGATVVTASAGQTAITRGDLDTAYTTGALTRGSGFALEQGYNVTLNESDPTSYPAQLNALAQALHDRVNAQHAAGFDLNGAVGGEFFTFAPAAGPPGAAKRIGVSQALLDDPRLVAASDAAGAPGSNVNALAMIGLKDATTVGGTTFAQFYTSTITRIGADASAARSGSDASDLVASGLESRRASVSGVSLDEEMTNMLKFQHAYSAAARVLSAMDDNLNRLINSTGRVGL